MIALLQHAHRPYHHIRLTKQFSADVAWWRTFIVMWNGVGIFPPMAQPTVEFTSDASGNWGCGAWSGTAWFQFQWPQGAAHRHIAFLELVAVLLASTVWARCWYGQSVLCRCDNQAAVQVISSRSCRDPGLTHLMRCLFFLEATYQFELTAVHVAGRDNQLADDLSRNQLSSFRSKVPQEQIKTPAASQWTCPACCSTNWTGPHRPGQGCGLLLLQRTSRVNT